MEAENEKLRKLLQESRIEESASADFTDQIIRQIQAASTENVALKSLLRQHAFEIPSVHFEQKILAQLAAAQPVAAPKPLIQKQTWYWIAAAFALLMIVGFVFQSGKSENSIVLFEAVSQATSKLYLPGIAAITDIILPTLFGFAALLILDFALRPAHKKLARPSGSG